MLKRLINKKTQPTKSEKLQPVIIPRAEHTISREQINPNALKVLYRLHNAGYEAYLVGGCVRDILYGGNPKDFDIATNATPDEIKKLFRNCRLIGKRFRLAHIVFGKDIIEVATFRTHHKEGHEQHGHSHEGMIIRDNVYGTIEDDVWRRDFTVNALYYNIADFSVLDYTGGMADLRASKLRMIGNAEQRFQEDPIRLLRALRFVGKLNLTIIPETEIHLKQLSHLLQNVSSARLFQEVLKFFQQGATLKTFKVLQAYHFFGQLFPQTHAALDNPFTQKLLETALELTDERLAADKTVSPAFLFAVFLWYPVQNMVATYLEEGLPNHVAYDRALRLVLRRQTRSLAIPKRLLMTVYDICFLQYRMTCRYGNVPNRLLEHQRYRAAYDLLQLRAKVGEPVTELYEWWTEYAVANRQEREMLIKKVQKDKPKKKGRRRRAASTKD